MVKEKLQIIWNGNKGTIEHIDKLCFVAEEKDDTSAIMKIYIEGLCFTCTVDAWDVDKAKRVLEGTFGLLKDVLEQC